MAPRVTQPKALRCLGEIDRIVAAHIRAPCDARMAALPRDDGAADGLKAHQAAGVRHIVSRYECGFGSILGDEMGLGKTRQAVAAMLRLRQAGATGPMLVAVPVVLLRQWQDEIVDHAQRVGMTPLPRPVIYTGSPAEEKDRDLGKDRSDGGTTPGLGTNPHKARAGILSDFLSDCDNRANAWPVLITTHNMMTQAQDFEAIRRVPGRAHPPARWALAVVDEAHKAKNPKSVFNTNLMRLDPHAFLLLTGTFVHNDLHKELMALIRFMLPPCLQCFDIVSHLNTFRDKQLWDHRNGRPHEAVLHIANILQAFLLRRVFGMRGVTERLPMRMRFNVVVPKTPLQARLYTALQAETPVATRRRKKGKSGSSRVSELHRAKLACDIHPFLLREVFDETALPDPMEPAAPPPEPPPAKRPRGRPKRVADPPPAPAAPAAVGGEVSRELEDLVLGASHKMRALMDILEALRAHGHRTLVFSKRMAALSMIALMLRGRGITFDVITGRTPTESRPAHMKRFEQGRDEAPWVMLLSTTAMGQGVTLTNADTVIFFDHHDNPQNDKQAEARSYRIGQTKRVAVVHLITKDSAEQTAIMGPIMAKRTIQDWFEYERPYVGAGLTPPGAKQSLAVEWATGLRGVAERSGWSDVYDGTIVDCEYSPSKDELGPDSFGSIYRDGSRVADAMMAAAQS